MHWIMPLIGAGKTYNRCALARSFLISLLGIFGFGYVTALCAAHHSSLWNIPQ